TLLEPAMGLIREGAARRAAFLHEIVDPIHNYFHSMRDLHLCTFSEVRTLLEKEETTQTELYNLLNQKLVTEHGTWNQISRLGELGNKRGKLGQLFAAYTHQLGRCLVLAGIDPEVIAGGIGYYLQLLIFLEPSWNIKDIDINNATLTEQLYNALWTRNQKLSGAQLEHTLREVNRITVAFHEFCADVDIAYLKLKEYCLT